MSVDKGARQPPRRIFLLSPASCAGQRARMLLRPEAQFELARRVQGKGAPLGEIFEFLSGLYFRGKLAYADRFGRPPKGGHKAYVISSNRGLLPLDTSTSSRDLHAFERIDIDVDEHRYVAPLQRSVTALAGTLTAGDDVVLLGSVATPKYTGVLLPLLGPRLQFPSEFVGRGDMSRGGLMLRCARSGEELEYVRVEGAVLHGRRPAKLLPPR